MSRKSSYLCRRKQVATASEGCGSAEFEQARFCIRLALHLHRQSGQTRLLSDNSVMVMYINDVCAYTNRIYGIQKNCWSINNYGGSITVSDVKISQY